MSESETRARIREAALRQFAQYGFKGATIRGIAQDAGVSAGLVQHHFPSKQALREECDAYAWAYLRAASEAATSGPEPMDRAFLTEALHSMTLLTPYVAMAMVGDNEIATRWFDELSDLYRDLLTSGALGPPPPEDEDIDAIVATQTAMNLGLAILAKQMYRRLGADEPDSDVLARLGRARIYLATHRLLDEEHEARIRQGFDDYEGRGESHADQADRDH